MLVTGGCTALTAVTFLYRANDDTSGKVIGVAAMLGLVGYIVLDQDGSSDFQFATLSPKKAENLGIEKTSLEIYNSEINELNAVKNSVSAELSRTESPSLEKSAALWREYQGALSPETFEVMRTIFSQSQR